MKVSSYKYVIIILSILQISTLITLNGQRNEALRFFPPNWWTGFENDSLEILIYSPDDIHSLNSKASDGIEILNKTSFKNARYASLLIRISPGFNQEHIEISVNGKKYKYPISIRNTFKGQPVTQNDVMYLITPDRFANGNAKNDQVEGMRDAQFGREHPFGRHGGDIDGINSHLDYLKNLGITSLWISPLLENDQPHDSYHGYAITDHYNIDPRFGTNEEYKALIEKTHTMKMSMVKDMVYNHFGTEHFLFKDLPDSSFFNFHKDHENGYLQTNYRATTVMDPHRSKEDYTKFQDGWFVRSMPDVNQRNLHMARYLIQNSIWLIETFKIDAFRIDTYIYPDQPFMAKLAQSITREYPWFYMFGETWVHGQPVQAYFTENFKYSPNSHLDAVTDFQMNYAFNEALHQQQGWIEGVSKIYYALAADYLYENPEKLVTFLDNHDMARFAGSMNKNLDKIKVGLAWLATMRGIPCVYYGTEIGMSETENHGLIREDFPGGWSSDTIDAFAGERNAFQDSVFTYLKKLLDWRSTSKAISGNLLQFIPENGVYTYFRYKDDDVVMVIANTTDKQQDHSLDRYKEIWKSGSTGTDIFSQDKIKGNMISLKPMSCRIIEMD
ncbi:MAG: hypothetical protein CMI35_18600 [Owenweeksia sp.]|nr:hypothetical protein [Owenweeksia sp.]